MLHLSTKLKVKQLVQNTLQNNNINNNNKNNQTFLSNKGRNWKVNIGCYKKGVKVNR